MVLSCEGGAGDGFSADLGGGAAAAGIFRVHLVTFPMGVVMIYTLPACLLEAWWKREICPRSICVIPRAGRYGSCSQALNRRIMSGSVK